ncbi:KxYKxGKxW signal peptide domain-containing protein [Loigolactobacillus iwatensis]|uniref:KxYKxGKxW signal peptide domain-containing protein n=1 Tax=Loigolactobacillus iwatensis TaxID=1267156 RepID=UPI000F7DF8CA|nr:KxYKxGKxW signal peptide domain-containing protein [Loigolactobacillus iwatensis]
MSKQKQELLNVQRDVKQHYKMYKAGKNWLFAGISIATFGSVLLFGTGNVKAATTTSTDSADEATETPTSTASELTAQSVALRTSTAATKSTSSAATTATSAASSTSATATTSSAVTKASSATPASTATATSSATNSSASTKVASSATAASTANSSAAATSTAAVSSATPTASSSTSSTATTASTVSSANTVSATSTATSSASSALTSTATTSSLSSQSATNGDSVATASSAATSVTASNASVTNTDDSIASLTSASTALNTTSAASSATSSQASQSASSASNSVTSSTATSAQTLIDPTSAELEQAKQAALVAYQQTGVAQVLTVMSAASTFNGHTIPDGYTVIYAQNGVIIAVNGVTSDGLSDQTNAGIVYVDGRTDVKKVYITSSTSAGTKVYLTSSINATTQTGTFSGTIAIPAGTTAFAIGIKDASTPGSALATYVDFHVDANGDIVDGNGDPAVVAPVVASATVTNASKVGSTFTYTVNGGTAETGTYGTALTDINVGDAVVVTPGAVDGYTASQTNGSFTASSDATANADVVTYIADQATVMVTSDSSVGSTFTYTVNGGTAKTGTYGTGLTDVNVGDTVVITPGMVDGYTATQSKSTFTASSDATANTDAVTYVAKTAAITVNYVDYFGNTIKTGTTTFAGNYGDVDNLTTNAATAVAIDGYTLGATDAVNASAAAVSFTLDANGNVIATTTDGTPITSITLTYKTNVTATVSGTRAYDGLDGLNNGAATSEQNDYKNLTFVLTDSKGKVLASNIDASDVTNLGIYYESADAGNYPDAVNITGKNLVNLKAANPQYNFLSISSNGDYTITAAPVTATIASDDTATKVYDGTAVSGYVPSVAFARTDSGTLAPNEGYQST